VSRGRGPGAELKQAEIRGRFEQIEVEIASLDTDTDI
jgi:hypothetical protein